jgi:hypothetical protein
LLVITPKRFTSYVRHASSLAIKISNNFFDSRTTYPLSSPLDCPTRCNRLICCGMRCYRGRVPPMELDPNKHGVHGAFQNVRSHRSRDEWVCQGTRRAYRAASLPTLPPQRVAFRSLPPIATISYEFWGYRPCPPSNPKKQKFLR